ncbi:hypothetical protein BK816_06095 [Boudabousia tangfeifanii]|uniref:Heat-inducible transcription repressor HrcA n=1 Tax=Boudabousia tangfeifanii TaxID=1912795 RepID=A0A1D9MKV5_9ACTO|nr:heat-inducible transcriptional repressor HrcA [Boudabousia tangfeifanii]AOZ72915.1 hypothetical protein BK816_06095 [Boudabousia tangfeifanii]
MPSSELAHPRRAQVLCALVSDYIATSEPVASKALVERHNLGVSPATVRNDMAVLENEGYIFQPHTSAGRVPTQRGYREFVNHIARLKPLSPGQRQAIQTFLTEPLGLGDVMDRTVRLLAQLTKHTAVIQYPSVAKASLRHIELVPLSPSRALIIVIGGAGEVNQQMVDLPTEVDPNFLNTFALALNAHCAGRDTASLPTVLTQLVRALEPSERPAAQAISTALEDLMAPVTTQKIAVAGWSNLARFSPDFAGDLGPIIAALEEQAALLSLFAEAKETPVEQVQVAIGAENHAGALAEVAVVTSRYGQPSASAQLGVVGPTRMDYAASMSAVRAVAKYLSKILDR